MMSAMLRHSRWPNLLIVALIQLVFYYQFVYRPYEILNLGNLSFSIYENISLLIITGLITLGGYLINDYFDYELDENKVNQTGERWNKRHIYSAYWAVVMLGLVMSVLLAFVTDQVNWFWLYPASGLLLYAYSQCLKCIPLLGNVLVSLFCSAVPFVFCITEDQVLNELQTSYPSLWREWRFWTICYIIFAFTLTLIREIIKDIEDVSADKKSNCKTLATQFGTIRTLLGVKYLFGFLLLSMAYAIYHSFGFVNGYQTVYLLIMLISIILLKHQSYKAAYIEDFTRLSSHTKLVMTLGIGLFFCFQI